MNYFKLAAEYKNVLQGGQINMSKCFKTVYWIGIAVCAVLPIAQGYFGAKQFTMFWNGTDTPQVIFLAEGATIGVQLLLIATGCVLITSCIKIVKQVTILLATG
jgi:hypothetical protein